MRPSARYDPGGASPPRRALPIALVLAWAAAAVACDRGAEALPPLTEVPVFPGATPREAESEFQRRLLSLVDPRGGAARVEVYGTRAAFAAVSGFYEPYFRQGASTTGRFFVGSRIRELAEGARKGLPQQLAAGRLLFGGRAGADSLEAGTVADSLSALAGRLENVEGLITVGRVALATRPPTLALVSVERPHLDASRLEVDSLTVFTIVTPGAAAPVPAGPPSRGGS